MSPGRSLTEPHCTSSATAAKRWYVMLLVVALDESILASRVLTRFQDFGVTLPHGRGSVWGCRVFVSSYRAATVRER
jgi:hypothetical protein